MQFMTARARVNYGVASRSLFGRHEGKGIIVRSWQAAGKACPVERGLLASAA